MPVPLLNELAGIAERRAQLLQEEAQLWRDAARVLTASANTESTLSLKAAPAPPETGVAPEILRTDEAATYLGVSPQTLAKWRLTGDGPVYIKLGRRVRYRRATLDEFVSRKTYPNTSAYPWR